jgi:hypothetical protein
VSAWMELGQHQGGWPTAGSGSPAAGRGTPAAGGWPEVEKVAVGGDFLFLFLEVFRFFFLFRDI